MAPIKNSGNKYSVILPTYNERKNLPIITWLLNRTFTEKCVIPFLLLISLCTPASIADRGGGLTRERGQH